VKAVIAIRDSTNYHHSAWVNGLLANGYSMCDRIDRPEPDDVLLLWNRNARDEPDARNFEKHGATVLVAENGYMGKWWNGHKWFALSVGHHNGAGWIPDLPDRWNRYGFEFPAWKTDGTELVFLPQRGIGEHGIAMQKGWNPPVNCRTRPHPGINPCVELPEDLKNARAVLTWGSGAAIKAIANGVPCFHGFREWICKDASIFIDGKNDFDSVHLCDRLPAFRRVLSGMWTASEHGRFVAGSSERPSALI
jgi:hypothetical protein